MSIKSIGAFALAVCLGLATSAIAHPHLRMGNPPVNGTVTGTLKELRLTFSEAVSPRVSRIKITDSKGKAIPTGLARQDSKNVKQLVVPLKTVLKAGRYQLNWLAVGKDMHPVKGRYAFTVKS